MINSRNLLVSKSSLVYQQEANLTSEMPRVVIPAIWIQGAKRKARGVADAGTVSHYDLTCKTETPLVAALMASKIRNIKNGKDNIQDNKFV